MKQEAFVREFRDSIISWVEGTQASLLKYQTYLWKGRTYEQSVARRNELEAKIQLSRQKNSGGIDLATANEVYQWGFTTHFYLQDDATVREVSRKAFSAADQGDAYSAIKTLMPITWKRPHPAGASKILGLSDQRKFCIYDSRVGNALKTLKKNNQRIILCPSGHTREGDSVAIHEGNHVWAENYQKLLWTLHLVRAQLLEKQPHLEISDLEMALFMMGQ